MAADTVPREKWWKIQWYSDGAYLSWSSQSLLLYLVSEAHEVAIVYASSGSNFVLITAVDDTPEERKFIIKLDLIVVPYAVLAYWVKYIGSTPNSPSRLYKS